MNTVKQELFTAINTHIDNIEFEGETVLEVYKNTRLDEYDIDTYVVLNDLQFHNGIIEVKMYSQLLADAPDFARGFIGIVYRANHDHTKFESFYVRPTNGRSCNDPIRRNHGCQYFSYPKYTFAYFRENHITDYEAQVDIDLGEWIQLKAEIIDDKAKFYINDQLILIVNDMKHGKDLTGQVGFYVDTGTLAYYKDLHIIQYD